MLVFRDNEFHRFIRTRTESASEENGLASGGAGTGCLAVAKTHLSHSGPYLSTPKPLHVGAGCVRSEATATGIA
jgi:hypothetical protein